MQVKELLNSIYNYINDDIRAGINLHCIALYDRSLDQIIEGTKNASFGPDYISTLNELYTDLKSPGCGIGLLNDLYEVIDDLGGVYND